MTPWANKRPIRGAWRRSPVDSGADARRAAAAAPTGLCQRLVGMETEYVTRLRGPGSPPAAEATYQALREEICREVPAVAGTDDPEKRFLANGAALCLETQPMNRHRPGGLMEMATPEVPSIASLVTCQRSLDRMMESAAASANLPEPIRIVKNSRDGAGYVYGCQENYDAEVARGAGLLLYRICILVLWGMQVLCILASLPIFLVAVLATFFRSWRSGDWSLSENRFRELPDWLTGGIVTMLRLVHWPLTIGLRFVIRHVAFRRARRYLSGHLVSRICVCGAGGVDEDGCFQLSSKAAAIDRVSDMGGFNGERPIFVFGHWLAMLFGHGFFNLGETKTLLARRQRLQIGLSDSNVVDQAEFVKVGSVSLLLDMIESGCTRGLPVVSRPLLALRVFNTDWNLIRRAASSAGELSALEMQHRIWKAARDFVRQRQFDTSSRIDCQDAEVVLTHWADSLRRVREFRHNGHHTVQGVGHVDWLGKLHLIDQLGPRANATARRKIDLKYHELSPDGYLRQWIAADDSSVLINEAEIELRRRWPPDGSPAARRGCFIREFANGDEPITANWTCAHVGTGKSQRVIAF